MKNSVENENAKPAAWNALTTGVCGAFLAAVFASAGTLAQESSQKPGVSLDQQQRIETLKAKGPEASLTILPVRLLHAGTPLVERAFRDRVSEVVGFFLEQRGLQNIELGRTAFEPAAPIDMAALAVSLAEFVKQHPITTEYVLYAELRTDGLSAIVADKRGGLVWSDRLTAQDKPFQGGRPEPMLVCLALVDRLSPQLGLNAKTVKAAKPGKMAAIMAERSGMPPENERTPLPARLKEMKKALPRATLVVFSPRVRPADKGVDAGGAAGLARSINEAGLCKAEPAKQPLLLKASQADPNEMKVLWDLAREFRDHARNNPTGADYVLYADYGFNPQHWEQGFVHFIVCDRQGEWVVAELVNAHHPEYQSVKPTSQSDCDKILVKRLAGRLR